MRVSALHVYPVKSCRSLALKTAEIGRRGIAHDRRWMIVDDAGTFVTQREASRLSLVDVALDRSELLLSADGHGQVRVSAPTGDAPRREVRVWTSRVAAVDCGDAAADWLGAFLGAAVRLVTMPDDVERQVDPEYGQPGDIVGFADGFPLLLATTASLADLNARLPQSVPMDRFRPNVVVEGCAPWEEDDWQRVRIGEVAFRVAKPCGRCSIVTTDQRTGERGVEPLRALATFRQQGSKVNFGQNCIPDAGGFIAVGDEVQILTRRG
jgi:uncharacterized protein YcbX